MNNIMANLFQYKIKMLKILDRIDINKFDWDNLCKNPNAIEILKQN